MHVPPAYTTRWLLCLGCGHCKKMKPGYTDAAQLIKDEDIPAIVAAVDATKHRKVAEEYKIKGFPTLKYFK